MTSCLQSTINKVYVVTQYNSQSLNRWVGSGWEVEHCTQLVIRWGLTHYYSQGPRWGE